MAGPQNKPFFKSMAKALAINLLVAAALTTLGLLDVITNPFGRWESGQPAPTTYRETLDNRCAFDELLQSVDKGSGRDRRFLVERGQPVNLVLLEDLGRKLPERKELDGMRALGVFAYYFLILTIFVVFLRKGGGHQEMRFRAVATLYLLLLLTLLGARLLLDYTNWSLYAIPVALPVLLLAPLVRQSFGLAIHLVAVALIGPTMPTTPGMMLVPLAAGFTAVLLLKSESGPLRVLLAGVAGAGVGALTLAGMKLFSPDTIDLGLRLQSDLTGIAGGMIGLGLLAALLHSPITLFFGAIPRGRLARLRDLQHPVLRDLAEKAPGTFQHTLAVANLAEKVALDIGADDELTRVGAYYHDIGKMRQPIYFSENQQADNPHNQLKPSESVAKLRDHVAAGVTIARGADLPERLVDFIVEHHGRSTMDYFLNKASTEAGQPQPEAAFAYEGRNPTSRETAVLMVVDSVEAASRTLREPSHKDLEQLVRQIVFTKLLRGYLDDSGLTTRDLKRLGQSLVNTLQAQFHVRPEYPWQAKAEATEPQAAPAPAAPAPVEPAAPAPPAPVEAAEPPPTPPPKEPNGNG